MYAKKFALETILTVTTSINYTDYFGKVYDLAGFVFDDDILSPLSL